ncbi:MAG: hypothetical protein KC776_37735 [Myxococcales bacterium]|nr:hypothetical protein [Myxococcales bacterium]MCB9577210.1 hypothetical protein [Polyangiaceae bacterium]
MRRLLGALCLAACSPAPPPPVAPVTVAPPPRSAPTTAEAQLPKAPPAAPLPDLPGNCQGVAQELHDIVARGIPERGQGECGASGELAVLRWHSGPQRDPALAAFAAQHGAQDLGSGNRIGFEFSAYRVQGALWVERPCMMCRMPSYVFELAAPWRLSDDALGRYQQMMGLDKEPLLRSLGDWEAALRR